MPIPVTNFTTFSNGLLVGFVDESTNSPTTWTWLFGDGATSSDQNPYHVYAEAGEYSVTLTAENADGSNQIIKSLTLVVNSSQTILDIINLEVPTGITIPQNLSDHFIRVWQTTLSGNLDLADNNQYDEAKWPYLWKVLIARLVIRDSMLKVYREFVANHYSSSGDQDGAVKKVETGPTSIEFHDAGRAFTQMMKPGKNGITLFDEIHISICDVASKIKVKMSMCPKGNVPIVPIKVEPKSLHE